MIALGVQIGAPREAGWDDPIGLLGDCHRRIERFLKVLQLAGARKASAPLDEEARAAVEAALHYFNTSGQLHTIDEEHSLFPRLRAAIARSSAETFAIQALEEDHRAAQSLHDEVGELAGKWIAEPLTRIESKQLRSAIGQLAALYASHIREEGTVVFPAARKLLSAEELAALGAELRTRRSACSPPV